jgi:tryptophan synthase alpha subunit
MDMARTARGADNLEWTREVLAQAQTVEQLRQAQAVVLPLGYGLSMEQTAWAMASVSHAAVAGART